MMLRPRFGHRPDPVRATLAVVLLAALALRLFGLNWDQGQYLHPDERYIVDYVMIGRLHLEWPLPVSELIDPSVSGLNPRSNDPETGVPRSFAYGTLPLFVTEVAAEVMTRITGEDWHWRDRVYLIGRSFSALLDTGTVLLTFLIASTLASRRTALLAAVVAAFAPLSIQLAHFFTTDSWLTFFVALCLLWSIRAARAGTPRWFAAAGAALGLALATKGSVFALAAVIGVAIIIDAARYWRGGGSLMDSARRLPSRVGLAALTTILTFALFEPYALARPATFWSSFQEQADIHRGYIDVPYTRQYVGTVPVVYQVDQFVRWGFGPVAGVLALFGIILLVLRLWRWGAAPSLILLTWLGAYAGVIFLPESKFIRYLAPLAPVLAITAALALDWLWRLVSRRAGRLPGAVVGAGLVAGMALWGLAFTSVYAGEQPRIAASSWLYANAPSGSVISAFVWDDTLPLSLAPGLDPDSRQYQIAPIDIYASGPTQQDLNVVGEALASDAGTSDVGDTLQSGDYAAAAAMLNAGNASVTEPDTTANALQAASDQLSPTATELQASVASLAGAIRDRSGVLPEQTWRGLAEAIQHTGDELTSNQLYDQLQAIDYVVISSNRVPAGITNLPWRYPVQIQFLRALEAGDLGFDLAYEATDYPRLGPLQFVDDGADEAWLNYDHPHVWVYEKSQVPSKPAFDAMFAEANAQTVSPTRYPPDEPLMLDEPVDTLAVVNDARWSAAFTENSAIALVIWLVLLVILQVVGLPLAGLAFGRFADGGWGFSRLLAMLVSGYLVWIASSLQFIAFRAIWCAAALLAVGLVGWLVRINWRRGRVLWRSRPGRPEAALWAEVVFWAIFALFLAFRLINPDSWHPEWGGEKPMEFAHLNAILRSAHFPPYDPWFAGGYINYYYYGIYLVAFLIKLTGIPSEIAFNLAQPTVIALLASGAFTIGATLGRDLVRRRSAAVPAGLVGAFLMVGIGNLTAFTRYLDAPAGGVADAFDYYTWAGSRAIPDVITEFPYFTGLYADLHAHVVALPITVLLIGLAYALATDSRRLLAATMRLHRPRTVDVLPLLVKLLTAALALGSLGATNAWDVPIYLGLIAVAILMASWSIRSLPARFATTAVLSGIVAIVAYVLFLPFFLNYVAIFGSLGQVAEATALGPFFSHFGALLSIVGVGLVALCVASSPIRGPAWFNALVPLGLVGAVVVLPGLSSRLSVGVGDGAFELAVLITGATLLIASLAALRRRSASERFVVLVGGLSLVAALALNQLVIALMIGFVTCGFVVWLAGSTIAARFTGITVVAAASIIIGTEIVFLADDLVDGAAYRMNTVFKFYNQGWVLLSVASAALATWMGAAIARGDARRLSPAARSLGITSSSVAPANPRGTDIALTPRLGPMPLNRTAWSWSQAGLIVTVALVAASLFYPALATGPRLSQRFEGHPSPGTLNSLDWMRYGTITAPTADGPRQIAFDDDLAAIDWFNTDVEGSPVIAEASIGPYRGNGSRVSIATGLPTVVGWARHEYQQRYPDGITARERDVHTLYDSPDPRMKSRILAQYDVTYVVVGDVERAWTRDRVPYASAAGIAAFDEMVGTSLEIAFQQGGTTVYRVIGKNEP